MKRKSPRGIPDFSSKGPKKLPLNPKKAPPPEIESHLNEPRPHSAMPKTKPPATFVKFGRRGA